MSARTQGLPSSVHEAFISTRACRQITKTSWAAHANSESSPQFSSDHAASTLTLAKDNLEDETG